MTTSKAMASVTDDGDDSPTGSFHVILSTPGLDRDNERLTARALEPLPEHINFDIDHAMTVEKTIGSGRPFYDEQGRLNVKGTYASTPLAQTTRTLVKEGHIRTTSVVFMQKEAHRAKDGIKDITKGELLNGSFVCIPANREAVVLAAKAMEVAKAGARHSGADMSHLQSAHDHLCSLGAVCAMDTNDPAVAGDGNDVQMPKNLAVEADLLALELVLLHSSN